MRNALICLVFILGTLTIVTAEGITHEVQRGETLYSIARSYGVTPGDLVRSNGIESPELLLPGTLLTVPGQYRVRKGDTLFSISRSYGISVAELSRLNDLDGSTIVAGQRLRVPLSDEDADVRIASDTGTPSDDSVASNDGADANDDADDGADAGDKGDADDDGDADDGGNAGGDSDREDPAAVPRSIPVALSITEPLSFEEGGAWPVAGSRRNLEGKFPGVMIQAARGTPVAAVSAGRIVYSGPHSSFGNVVFVQSRQGYVYVYGGQETVAVSVGDEVAAGMMLGTVGVSPTEGSPALYFSVWRNNRFVDPEQAPRG
jgi:murein DD-endopeptidase MepM/ murein hydrolase activator NlpD